MKSSLLYVSVNTCPHKLIPEIWDEANNEDDQFDNEEPESYTEKSNSVSGFRLTTEYAAIRAGYADTRPKKKGGGVPFRSNTTLPLS